jgi:acyl-coenzyme A synthetase/AMP-(fatty) acid ligase
VARYKRAELNKKAFTHDGWLNTGDRAYKDEDGYIWILGRQSDFILWENRYISLLAVELALQENPFIKKAAVIGSPALGERVHAFIMIDQEAMTNLTDLIQQLSTMLKERFGSIPVDIEVRDNLPLNGMGKVMKYRLKEEMQAKQPIRKAS